MGEQRGLAKTNYAPLLCLTHNLMAIMEEPIRKNLFNPKTEVG